MFSVPAICTIVSKNYLGYARALVRSFRQQHPDGRAWVLVVDQPDGCFNPADEPFNVLQLSDLRLRNERAWVFRYTPFELCNSLKPVLLRHLLVDRGESTVLYLDSDIGVFGPLDTLVDSSVCHGLVITPHCTVDFPRDGFWPDREVVQTAGVFNAGVIGISDSAVARRFLDWWTELLEFGCILDHDQGIHHDQRYLDLVPTLFPESFICRHAGVNVGHFNLHYRTLGCVDGNWTSNSERLLLFHFTQVNWEARDFWPPVSRPLAAAQPLLRELIANYAALLDRCGLATTRGWPNSYARFADGTPISPATRDEFRRQTSDAPYPRNPYTEDLWLRVEKRVQRRQQLRQLAGLPSRLWQFGRRVWRRIGAT